MSLSDEQQSNSVMNKELLKSHVKAQIEAFIEKNPRPTEILFVSKLVTMIDVSIVDSSFVVNSSIIGEIINEDGEEVSGIVNTELARFELAEQESLIEFLLSQ